ncbi:MAG TPA: HIT domain-containing protein [Candidatus Omnitrophota bacterium]|nr:HIT domain-containing protein [Candidatus Omnitrophota bacterium]HSA30563.1 HIT domain-containing protein [Candidatus Omnitrophota bacterium]
MDKLWAPWRSQYLTAITDKKSKTKKCLFCRIAEEQDDRKNAIFVRREHCYAVLNIFPYNNGHSLVVPYRHVSDLSRLNEEEKLEFFALIDHVKGLMVRELNPDGFNIGMNIGKAAGAGVPDHIHMHIVPRWLGDVNFMPVISETKVISQSLNELYKRLSAAHKAAENKKKT